MPGLESDVVPLSPDPVAPPMRPFFHPWATWLSTALVVLLVGYAFVLSPGDPLDHLRWPEDSLERLAGRDMEMRGAMARAPRWERQLYAIVSGGDESVDDWVRWHDELAQLSSSPDVELNRLILLGEAGRTALVREGVEEWEPDDAASGVDHRRLSGALASPRHGSRLDHRGARRASRGVVRRRAGRPPRPALRRRRGARAGRVRHRRARRHHPPSLARAAGGGSAAGGGGIGKRGRD